MGQLHIKPGVDFGPNGLAPAGQRILFTLMTLVAGYPFDLTITSARDGVHSGPGDPHYSGEALDIRSHDLTEAQKVFVLHDLQMELYREPRRFYVFLEGAGTPSEHYHVQRRNGTSYTTADLIARL